MRPTTGVRVKVCGITNRDDARRAADLGASAVGFVFWASSPRVVSPETARQVVEGLPPGIVPVGVFVNEARERVETICRVVGLGAVQLHGDETPQAFTGLSWPIIRAVACGRHGQEASAGEWPDDVVLLVDADDRDRRGGTGRRADWAAAARLARLRPIFLAGGLTPQNVGEAVETVRPYGVDVSSGVESAPGVKDAAKLEAFFEAVARTADAWPRRPIEGNHE
jgi:phosphoribosylanthranilate isomerase